MGEYIGVDYLPTLMAPDPGGIGPHAASFELLVLSVDTPVQHSPITNWNPGSPYPGPPATVHHYVDMDSAKWWGRTGQGQLVWSNHTEQIGELPPMLPADLVQHVDTWQSLWAGYPSIARNRPLTERQIDAMADRYRARTLAMRAETIARTEGVHATSLAREEAVDQMIDTTGIVATRVIGTWHPTQDARVRDFHASMLNQKRPRGTPFVDGHGNRLLYPGDRNAPSETTINCRCGVTYSIAPNA